MGPFRIVIVWYKLVYIYIVLQCIAQIKHDHAMSYTTTNTFGCIWAACLFSEEFMVFVHREKKTSFFYIVITNWHIKSTLTVLSKNIIFCCQVQVKEKSFFYWVMWKCAPEPQEKIFFFILLGMQGDQGYARRPSKLMPYCQSCGCKYIFITNSDVISFVFVTE